MAGTKRPIDAVDGKASKKPKTYQNGDKKVKAAPKKAESEEDFVESDDEDTTAAPVTKHANAKPQRDSDRPGKPDGDTFLNGNTSREAHAKQKALAQDRKAAKPHADSIARSKKLWEQLRRKSHVPKAQRDELVKELFEIISGRVKDFVFKHDSVRVIQCALKYATPDQRRHITQELKGSYRELAESKYAKFLIAKMVVGNDESRDAVVEEFYGHVKRLIRHPEASWILDDIYRTIATKQQKAILLREWYGPEFVVFAKNQSKEEGEVTADLAEILKQNPEKRGPIMQHLKEMTNQLVQKKTTGFTILHDALLQYFLNCKPGSPELTEFLDMLRDDEEGETVKNLAFTRSGSRLVCLALAYGSSKDRRTILKFFKTHIKLLASDVYGHTVLLTAYDVIDDTVMSSKGIFPELLGKELEKEAGQQELMAQVEHLNSRIPLLYLMSPEAPKWLVPPETDTTVVVKEIREIRTTTSKKDPEIRRLELLKGISQPLLDLIASQARFLAKSTLGCQFIAETLFGAVGDKEPALRALVDLATNPGEAEEDTKVLATPAVGRMLKSLVQGGRFDKATQSVIRTDPPLMFHDMLYTDLKGEDAGAIIEWANGPNSFVIVAMLEADDFSHKEELVDILKQHASALKPDNPGAKIILEKIGGASKDKEAKKGKKARKSV
ncbi:Pumilio y domain member 6 [Elasticomyces elasticus]|uniref:Pumilio y domain member 6 n=1 Tax=Exophiala sideris TaxID=1016849 RepID=A0ABR0IWX4_9EURO|nr:Pumilio y domain member 6 [Elasticomyces elasticus]KAK5021961.1 Pumilio y domain member 6 [Exophiala sideris]KAK5026024.1 Pumilio y domain member 6 [Exophiala sideris]KAK5050711.1 Pumilio y domain member 6 [Exophiala sideris]KAK5177196.1 Pumilio y domain member 6 [Eurotiomycetes sp. CCFEE 6388]